MVNLLDKKNVDEQVQEYEAKLRKEMGLEAPEVDHFQKPFERPWTKEEKDSVTILFGGMTAAHDELVEQGMSGLGYNIRLLPCPDNDSLSTGKEYGNRGQCNPTYYTVGNLVKYLKELRDQGEKDIEDRYVFVTAGACGPCRFGMYEAEYRKALRDAGFNNFRVMLFKQSGGLNQDDGESALELNAKFGLTLIKGIMVGDMINDLGYKIRPYEIEEGETDRVTTEAKEILGYALKNKKSIWRALRRVRKMYKEIKVDYTRVKPKVKITGEFWAQTTEGDGNYHMFRWLESEGAEVLVEPIGTWIEYLIWAAKKNAEEHLVIDKTRKSFIRKVSLVQFAFRTYYNFYRWGLGFKSDSLPNQKKLAEYAGAYYDSHLKGGEGHLEVAKNIMATKDKHAQMVISLKPFGCMPSTMSDGVQSKVVADYKDAIYLPIETSGDGEVNVKSRTQMKLYEAKIKSRQEINNVLDHYDVTIEQVKEYVAKHPKYNDPMRKLPHNHGISTAANFVAMVAPHIK